MHEGMAASHERMARLDETRSDRPGVAADERAYLLTRAAQHRVEAVTERGKAAEDRLEAAIDRDRADEDRQAGDPRRDGC
jgi:hypothetical protein